MFSDDELAFEFSNKFQRVDDEKYIKKLKNELVELQEKLKSKVERGAYNLGRYPANQRRFAAIRFIQNDAAIHNLTENIECFETARNLKEGWRTQLSDRENLDSLTKD